MSNQELKQFAILGSYNNLMLKAIMQRLFGVKEAQKACNEILEIIKKEYEEMESTNESNKSDKR